jgi:hypothetical protein
MPSPTLPEALAMLRAVIERDFSGFVPLEVVVLSKGPRKTRRTIRLPIPQVAMPTDRPLSPTEQQIVNALADGAWHTGPEIAEAIGRSMSGAFGAVLSNLAETPSIESSTKNGYRLPPAGKKSDD